MLSDKADLSDPDLTNALKAYFDKSSPKSNRVKYCGVALICFDVTFYPADDAQKVAEEMIEEARLEIEKVVQNVSNHLTAEKLSTFEIQLLCVPLPSVDAFRTLFRQTLGLSV